MAANGIETFLRVGPTVNVAYTGTAGTTSAIGNATGNNDVGVQVTVTTDAFVKVGNGTATSSDMFLPANTPLVFKIPQGQTVSAIQSAVGGTLYATRLDS